MGFKAHLLNWQPEYFRRLQRIWPIAKISEVAGAHRQVEWTLTGKGLRSDSLHAFSWSLTVLATKPGEALVGAGRLCTLFIICTGRRCKESQKQPAVVMNPGVGITVHWHPPGSTVDARLPGCAVGQEPLW